MGREDPPRAAATTEQDAATSDEFSNSKHLNRLVRFSILQARRSSSKAARAANAKPAPIATKPATATPAAAAYSSPKNLRKKKSLKKERSPKHSKSKPPMSPSAEAAEFPSSFAAEKERPSTEVAYQSHHHHKHDAPVSHVGVIAGDPPIMEDLSNSFGPGSGSYSNDGVHNEEDLRELLAPDSGDNHMSLAESLSSQFMSAEERISASDSGSYTQSHSMSGSSASSDSIMRRVEEEIANARQASNDAQARLAYFSQRQRDLTPDNTNDTFSFDFEGRSMSAEKSTPTAVSQSMSTQRGIDPPVEDNNFQIASRESGLEFTGNDSSSPVGISAARGTATKGGHNTEDELEEKVDIEVVLAPTYTFTESKGASPDSSEVASPRSITSKNSKVTSLIHAKSPPTVPEWVMDGEGVEGDADVGVEIDDKLINAVFSEQSIGSLPTQECSFQDGAIISFGTPLSPANSAKRTCMVTDVATAASGGEATGRRHGSSRKSPSKLTIQTDARHTVTSRRVLSSPSSATTSAAASPNNIRSKLPSTPREPGTPSYREKLENKLKILGSRYPGSPIRSPSSKTGTPKGVLSPANKYMEDAPPLPPGTSKDSVTSPPASTVSSPLGEAYDGLEHRIKGLLARTLNPESGNMKESREKGYQVSPSGELRAIKKLLAQGVAQMNDKNVAAVSALSQETTAQEASFRLYGNDAKDTALLSEVISNEALLKEVQSIISTTSQMTIEARAMIPEVKTPKNIGGTTNENKKSPDPVCSTNEEILEQLNSFSQSEEYKIAMQKVSPKNSNEKRGEEGGSKKAIQQILGQPMPDATDNGITSCEVAPCDKEIQSLVSPSRKVTKKAGKAVSADHKEAKGQVHDTVALVQPPKKAPSALNLALMRPSSPRNEIKAQKCPEENTSSTRQNDLGSTTPKENVGNTNNSQKAAEVPEHENEAKNENEADKIEMNPDELSPAANSEEIATSLEQSMHDKDCTKSEENAEMAVTSGRVSKSSQKGKRAPISPIELNNQSMLASLIAPSESNPSPDQDQVDENASSSKAESREKSLTLVTSKSSQNDDENKPPAERAKPQPRPHVSGSQERKIRFRDAYPTPMPCRKARTNEEIQSDHSCMPAEQDYDIKWKEPKGDLKRLLIAALDTSVSRRSNACGALKVISKQEKNKIVLVTTKGFLDALVFVATNDVSTDEPDGVKEDARARAISCIYNVSFVKRNRLPICIHPGLLKCLVKTISEASGEARMEASGTLVQLAKNPMCREHMVQEADLLSTLGSILKGGINSEETTMNVLSEGYTEDAPSSCYSEMSSVLSEEHIPFPKKSQRSPRSQQSTASNLQAKSSISIRKQRSDMHDQCQNLSRLNACAALVHLSKQCSILVSILSVYLFLFLSCCWQLLRTILFSVSSGPLLFERLLT